MRSLFGSTTTYAGICMGFKAYEWSGSFACTAGAHHACMCLTDAANCLFTVSIVTSTGGTASKCMWTSGRVVTTQGERRFVTEGHCCDHLFRCLTGHTHALTIRPLSKSRVHMGRVTGMFCHKQAWDKALQLLTHRCLTSPGTSGATEASSELGVILVIGCQALPDGLKAVPEPRLGWHTSATVRAL